MRSFRFLAVMAVLLIASVSAFAQVTGVLTGTVTTDGNPLPGATVSVTSPSLQGTRTAVTDANGNYNIAALPPGDYTVKTELSGLTPITRTVRVTLSGTARSDAELRLSAVTEAITVTAAAPAVLETTEVQTNYQKKAIDDLPIGRTVTAIAALAPGTTQNGPNNGLQISGATSNDNLIMVNGANIQENLRGQARPLFIEDAIQETTVITGAVSAEFGRFTGGVVNSITKSGGNEFSGSVRDSFDNGRWTAKSAFDAEVRPKDVINQTYEGTLGGRIIRDRLWFFTAGRMSEVENPGTPIRLSGIAPPVVSENTRYEVKLTGQITPKHSLVGNYLSNPFEASNNNQLGVYELQALDPSIEQVEDFKAAHYSGVFTNNLLAEVNWSERNFTFVGFGGENKDLIAGTPIFLGGSTGSGQGVANAPYFCGSCDEETRNNEFITAKMTYFLGTGSLGTHNIVGGVERFSEARLSNNYQSPTNLVVELYGAEHKVNLVNGQPVFTLDGTNGNAILSYYPVEIPSIGSDLQTDSFFFNDKWDLNTHFSFNLGARYDTTSGADQQGNKTADDSAISPRLGVIYDVVGNGRVRLNASYANYVGRLAEGVQNAGSGAGSPSGYYYYYDGPTITGTSNQIVTTIVNWFKARGGINLVTNPPDVSVIGGVSTQIKDGSLKAPGVDEWTIGGGFQFGSNGYFRADYINRDWNNAYTSFTNLSTGQVTLPSGGKADLTLVGNSDELTRTYKAIQSQANYRLFNRLNIGGNYTWSELKGNAESETGGSGPVSEGGWIFQYPEYQGFAQNRPTGFLSGDQTHKLRAWAAMDFALGPVGTMNVSLLQRFDSGRPFSLTTTLPRSVALNPAIGTAPKYISAPASVTYFLEGRGSRRFEDVTRTDIALNYRLPISRFELFFEGDVLNVFNEQAQVAGNTAVTRLQTWNPWTVTPVLGTHYSLPANFGTARNQNDYQLARTYQFSVGARF